MTEQCKATIDLRDTYRYSGRGPGGFSMHYNHRQCKRVVKAGESRCWQHRPVGGWIGRADAEALVLDMMAPPDQAARRPHPEQGEGVGED